MPSFLSKVFSRKNSRDGAEAAAAADNNDGAPPKSPPPPTHQRHHKSNPSLLEGKFEAVITPASPIASNFAEANSNTNQLQKQENEREGGGIGALFRAISRPSNPSSPLSPPKRIEPLPTLSFNHAFENGATPTSTSSPFSPFSPTSPTSPTSPITPSSSRVLGVVFEGDDRHIMLDESVIGATRLSPTEALVLIRACSLVIAERGLETLGIMHPHWHSASPEIQRRLISLFIHTLSSSSRPTQTSLSIQSQQSSRAQAAFESELKSTRSPHDVAAVLRWGLRHLKLEGSSFGLSSPSDPSEWSWYTTFFLSERTPPSPAQSYQLNAYTTHLPPLLPPAHLALLTATLEILSSLAAHAEGNGMGGSKLCRGLGWWVCSGRRDSVGESGKAGEGSVVLKREAQWADGWEEFYGQWEKAGRVLEHLFLARIRDESANHRIPTRLIELVKHYPYNKGPLISTAENKGEGEDKDKDKVEEGEKEELLLPRPRFSTRTYDALFVRIDTELPHSPIDDPSTPTNKSSSKISSKAGNKSTATIATTATSANRMHQQPKCGHLRLLAEAFNVDLVTELESGGDEDGSKYIDAWERIRSAALLQSSDDVEAEKDDDAKSKKVPVLNRVFADETVSLLSLIPGLDEDEDGAGVELVPGSLGVGAGGRVGRSAIKGGSRRQSSSLSHTPNYKGSNGTPTANGDGHFATQQNKPAASVPLPPSPVIDWAQFTTAGFEAGLGGDEAVGQRLFLTGLLDPDDVEVTKPPPVPASSSSTGSMSFPSPFSVVARTVSRSRSGKGRDASRRSSADSPNRGTNLHLNGNGKEANETVKVGKSKATRVKHIQLDEAFVDFWSDAVLDPISASWPTFVVCKLNPGVGVAISGEGGKRTEINWLVVEQTYTSPPVLRVASASRESGAAASGKRASSPKPSFRSDLSRMSSTFSASTRKRFSFFGGGSVGVASGKIEKTKAKAGTGIGRKSSVKGVRVGEMGEVLPEVAEKPEVTNAGTDVSGHVVSGVVTPTPLTAAAAKMSKSPKPEDRVKDKIEATPVKAEHPAAVAGTSTAVVVGAAAAAAIADVVDSKEETAEHPIIPEADATKETQKDTALVEAEPALPPAPEKVVLSGSTPGPQVALDTSELVAATTPAESAAVAVEPTHTPTPPVTADVAEATAPISAEDAPGPEVASDTKPATTEPLKVQDESASVLPVAEEIPVVSTPVVAEEATPAPKPESVAEPALEPVVDAAPLSPLADDSEEVAEAEAPSSAPEAESEHVVVDATPPGPAETDAAVEEEVEQVVESTEAPISAPEPEPESEPVPEPAVDATPPSPLAEAAVVVEEENESALQVSEKSSAPPAEVVEEVIPESVNEAAPEPAVELELEPENPVETVTELEASLPDEETSAPATEVAEESHPEPLQTPHEEASSQAAEEIFEPSTQVPETITASTAEESESPSTEVAIQAIPERISDNDTHHAEATSEPHTAEEAQ